MLYIISTPIGNLKDITLRAIEILEQLDVLLCEDTRRTGLLLQNLRIANRPKLVSFYDEVEKQKIPLVVEWLKEGLEVGLVTDAGTPLISDPGWLLVKKCQELELKYTALPGPSAVINAAVLSGLPVQKFCFLGFLPKKDGDKKKVIEKYKDFEGVKIAYEAGNRTLETVELLKKLLGETLVCRVVREMTKMYESVDTDGVGDERGEVVILWH